MRTHWLHKIGLTAGCLVWLSSVGACTHTMTAQDIPDPMPDDRRTIPAPAPRKVYLQQDGFNAQVSRQGMEMVDMSRQLRRATGNKKESFNTNAFDEVDDSSWFTNRHYSKRMSTAAIMQGSTTGNPPTLDAWQVVGAKLEGVTPGFTIKDSKDDRYVIKFDPPGWPELSTSVEMISSRIFHAAGYNTPEDYLIHFRPDIITIGDGVTVPDRRTRAPRPMTLADLDATWARVNHESDGTIRAVASKFISGKIIGPYRYHSTRADDPNDIVPHQHRRELRGLRVLAAWLNHWDTKANNSLDAYVTEDGRRYVKHYLIDFGSTLGSQGDEPMPEWVGYENAADPHQIVRNTVGLGLYEPSWYRGREVAHREIGLFDNKDFKPEDYKFIIANEAFEMLTRRDALWAAKLVVSFTDDDLRAAIASAEYSNPDAAAYLLRVLSERRDIIGRYYLSQVNALDHFSIGAGGAELHFKDILVESGLTEHRAYEYAIGNGDPITLGSATVIPLSANGPAVTDYKVRQKKLASDEWSNWVHAFVEAAGDTPTIAGVLRRE